jgi:hypothetical protein
VGDPVYTWTEIGRGHGDVHQWTITTAVPNSKITGMALLPHKAVYASLLYKKDSVTAPLLYQLVLGQNGKGRWLALPPANTANGNDSSPFWMLLGGDDTSLVHLRHTATPTASPMLYWSKP